MGSSTFALRPDASGHVHQVEDVSVGEARHRLTFEGLADRPVLMWLDGGLGRSELGSLLSRNGALLERFLLVHDERPASYSNGDEAGVLPALVAEVGTLIDLVREATGQPRIFLAGHSLGAAVAVLVAAECQDALHAYVGVNQPVVPVTDTLARLRLVLAEAAARGATSAARRAGEDGQAIGRATAGPVDLAAFADYVTALHRLTHDPVDLVRWAAANERRLTPDAASDIDDAASRTWAALRGFDALAHVPPLDIPMFFVAGRHDTIAPVGPLERFIDASYTPGLTRLLVLERSGHFAYWEEADAFNEFMLTQVLAVAPGLPLATRSSLGREPAEPSTPAAASLVAAR